MPHSYLSYVEPFDFEYGYSTFIRLICKAHLVFERDIKITDGDAHVKDWIILNDTADLSYFKKALSKSLQKAKSEIGDYISVRPSLFDKVLFMEECVKELEGHMSKLTTTENGLSHAKFSFLNVSKEGKDVVLTEAAIQEHYKVMKQYSADLLDHYKMVQQVVNKLTNKDFSIVKPVNPWESSKQTPLAFFENFFVDRGFSIFYDNFCNSLQYQYEYRDMLSIDQETETITYNDNGEIKIYSYAPDFHSELREKLIEESEISKTCIDSRIDELTAETDVVFYLKGLITRMNYIYMKLQKYDKARKYGYTTVILKVITRYVIDKYGSFDKELANLIKFLKSGNTPLQKEMPKAVPPPVQKEMPKALPPQETKKKWQKHDAVTGFKWLTDRDKNISKLYNALVAHSFISKSVKMEDFRKAFLDEKIESPLNIPWLGSLSKPLILFVFDQLMDRKLLERVDSNQELYKKISYVFVDYDNNPLDNFEEAVWGIGQRKTVGPTKKEAKVIVIFDHLWPDYPVTLKLDG